MWTMSIGIFSTLGSTYQTLNCPEFIDSCIASYSPSEKVIIDAPRSKIIFPGNPLVIRNTFFVPEEFNQKSREYSEKRIVQYFKEAVVEKKEAFFKACFKPNTKLKNYPYLVDDDKFKET